ncbi:sporulation protein [Bacillus tianshenii]|nr:sporulation protein [Bacillus tianshenii]
MHIPPYYKSPAWQRFFAGMFVGMLISWCVFLFMYGEMQEKQVTQLIEQQSLINSLKQQNEMWKEDIEKLNEENQKKLVIDDIALSLTNAKALKLDLLTVHTLKQQIQDELQPTLKQDIETIISNKDLLIKTVENKVYKLDQVGYKVKVKQLFISTTLEIHAEVKLVD